MLDDSNDISISMKTRTLQTDREQLSVQQRSKSCWPSGTKGTAHCAMM